MFFYFVRHGVTRGNSENRVQSPDEPLLERGEKQAYEVAHKLKALPFDVIYASHFARAHRTAEIIAEVTGKPLITNELFHEVRRPSALFNVLRSEPVAAAFYEGVEDNLHNHAWRHSDEENFMDASERARQAIAFLKTVPYEHSVIVTHGKFLRTLIATLLMGETLTHEIVHRFDKLFRTTNTGISTVEYEPNWDQWGVITWNDHAHLAEIK